MSGRIALLLGLLVVGATVAPMLAPYDPEEQHRAYPFAPPMPPRVIDEGAVRRPFAYPLLVEDRLSLSYREDRSRHLPLPWPHAAGDEPVFLLGADSLGRDVLSRLLHGARLSISLALAATLLALGMGAVVGVAAGYRGGWIDEAAMRVADFLIILPLIYVVLVLRAVLPLVLPASLLFVLLTAIFAVVGWPFVARGVRALVAVEREREYVAAARAAGAGGLRIMLRHLLPACAGHLLVQATILLPAFILAEATLSYVGLGFPEHVPTWGTMLMETASLDAITRFPWTLTPAAAIFLVVLTTNLMVQADSPVR